MKHQNVEQREDQQAELPWCSSGIGDHNRLGAEQRDTCEKSDGKADVGNAKQSSCGSGNGYRSVSDTQQAEIKGEGLDRQDRCFGAFDTTATSQLVALLARVP
ncbi:hypothetical protein ACWKW4_21965 [Hydrogenophaga borbori]